MNNKFELIKSDTKSFLGKTLYRIKALKSFSIFSKGQLGGYIEKESNLDSQIKLDKFRKFMEEF